MVNTYNLVNPTIKGQFNSSVKAKNSLEAAQKLYGELSQHFNNSVPKFFFTIQKGNSGNGKVYHFKVRESKTDDSSVELSIEQHNVKGATNANKKLLNKVSKFNSKFDRQTGCNK